MSTDPAETHRRAAAAMDRHMTECDLCAVGIGCPDGDDTAERELRAFVALDRDSNTTRTPTRWGRR